MLDKMLLSLVFVYKQFVGGYDEGKKQTKTKIAMKKM